MITAASSVLLIARGQPWSTPLNVLVGSGFLFLGLGTLRAQWRHPHPPAPVADADPERNLAPTAIP